MWGRNREGGQKGANFSEPQVKMMFSSVIRFLNSENGAVTDDWIVMCAGVIGISIVVLAAISQSATDQAAAISSVITDQDPSV